MVKIELRYGDITTLDIECIVNAANESGLGCHTPNHPCIDNAIHKAAGPGLYDECLKLNGVPTGHAKITRGHKLPAKFIIHATGPKTDSEGGENHDLLRQTYQNILELAKKHKIKEIAFCCISTGMYGFDKKKAANTQLQTIYQWLKYNNLDRIVFNVFTQEDLQIYKDMLRL